LRGVRNRPTRAAAAGLQRAQEIQQVLLLLGTQSQKKIDNTVGLRTGTRVILYGRQQTTIRGCSAAIMEKEEALPQAPQRRGAELIGPSCAL